MNLPDSPAVLAGMVMRKDEQIAELRAVLAEYVAAGDNTVTSDDDVSSMLRFGQASDAARALLAKHEAAHG